MAAAQYERPWRRIAADLRAKIISGRWHHGDRLPTMGQLQEQYGVAKGTIRNAIDQLRDDGLVTTRGGSGIYVNVQEAPPVSEPATTPEKQPVVSAIVTSALGVLVGQRRDGKPPWTFISGEIEPGEAQADAAVREVKEETGLLVVAGEREIGRRVHPKTGRTMIYLACAPSAGTDVFVGDEDELTDVRWMTLPEVEEAMAAYGMFEPVHEHLRRTIGQ
jgi:DNA-binding transcriptional regulator YhcF (GntR family)